MFEFADGFGEAQKVALCGATDRCSVAHGVRVDDVVPEHHVLVFGDSQDSLDSRYEIVGPVPVAAIEAVGWPLRIPHWKEIAAWLG